MITLTRINQSSLTVNSDLIEFIEATPDTTLSLTTGRKVIVTESIEEIIDKIVAFKQQMPHIR